MRSGTRCGTLQFSQNLVVFACLEAIQVLLRNLCRYVVFCLSSLRESKKDGLKRRRLAHSAQSWRMFGFNLHKTVKEPILNRPLHPSQLQHFIASTIAHRLFHLTDSASLPDYRPLTWPGVGQKSALAVKVSTLNRHW